MTVSNKIAYSYFYLKLDMATNSDSSNSGINKVNKYYAVPQNVEHVA